MDAIRDNDGYIEVCARTGYAARGVVYLVIGGLAVMAAWGAGGRATGSRGALESLLGAPMGSVLLLLLAAGLLGYSIWRAIQAVKDPDGHGTDGRGLAIRAGLAVSAVTHLLLAGFAVRLVTRLGGGSGSSQSTADWLMQQPFGRILVGAVGVSVIGAGIAHAYKGWQARFDRYLEMPPRVQTWAYPLCRFGLVTRGVVLTIIGVLFVLAGYYYDPSVASGVAGMFQTVRSQAFGTWLFGVIAVGLIAFGLYSLLEARYRRVQVG